MYSPKLDTAIAVAATKMPSAVARFSDKVDFGLTLDQATTPTSAAATSDLLERPTIIRACCECFHGLAVISADHDAGHISRDARSMRTCSASTNRRSDIGTGDLT
jgi:hypothetical protein